MLLCFPKLMFVFSRKIFLLANNFKQFDQTKLHVLISTARVKSFMCLCLVGTLFEDVSNKFRGENQNTEMIFFLDLG